MSKQTKMKTIVAISTSSESGLEKTYPKLDRFVFDSAGFKAVASGPTNRTKNS